jgi:hypothetical protein
MTNENVMELVRDLGRVNYKLGQLQGAIETADLARTWLDNGLDGAALDALIVKLAELVIEQKADQIPSTFDAKSSKPSLV